MIFFDIDRTLFDYDHAVDSAIEDFYREYRGELNVSLADFKQQWIALYEMYWPQYELGTLSLKEQRILRMQGLFEGKVISRVQAEKYARFHNDAYMSHWRLFDDALPLLDELQGRKLGVISNGNAERQRSKLRKCGILDRFEVIVISSEYGFAKPDVRIFNAACDLGGEVASQSIHIGDNPVADIAGAAGAGLDPVWVNRTNAIMDQSQAREVTSLVDLIGQI